MRITGISWVFGSCVVGLCLATVPGAHADDAKSAYWLLRPTPDHLLRELSTDRPDKTESPFTVDAGHVQLEMDLVSLTVDREGPERTRSTDIAPFNLKFGLTSDTDIQFVYGPYSVITTRDTLANTKDRSDGTGDLTIRIKRNLWGNDGGKTALAVMPFLKLPANSLPKLNNDIEGGVIVPLAIDLGNGFGLGLMTEVDWLKNATEGGYATSFINSATVSFDLCKDLGMYVELFTEQSTESGADFIATFDTGLTYALGDNVQLDAGVNIGLTDAADDFNGFTGLSVRY